MSDERSEKKNVVFKHLMDWLFNVMKSLCWLRATDNHQFLISSYWTNARPAIFFHVGLILHAI